MQSRYRLRSSNDIQRVRRLGKSYAHPLLVLVTLPNGSGQIRVAVSAGRSIGKAVHRNRAKRLVREAVRPLLPQIAPGSDILLLARRSMQDAGYKQAQEALLMLLKRSNLLVEDIDGDRQ